MYWSVHFEPQLAAPLKKNGYGQYLLNLLK